MAEKLWDGRFTEKTHQNVETFTSSIDTDKRLYAHDIDGSIAHARMLQKIGVLTAEELDAIIQGLEEIRLEIESGDFKFRDSLEDIHMHIESRLAEKIGRTARKLHTARSRNDQVALDVRMYLRDETRNLIAQLWKLRTILVQLANANLHVIMPGYTHLQRAQPILLSHHLMAYYEMFTRDAHRFADCLNRIDVMPLGSAALAGTTYPIDRQMTAQLLNFRQISANSIDAVSDRDFVIEFLACASICMVHLSRMSEEFVLWSSSEFDFLTMPDAFTTGSSIMPQKKNPDVAELVRGKTGSVFGNLMAMLTLMKGLPLAYNRDMQEDKTLLFTGVDTLSACIGIYVDMLPHVRFNQDVMLQATTTGFLNATDMADYLVGKGMPFREAHSCVGRAVAFALDHHKELHELTLEELIQFSELFSEDVYRFIETRAMVDRRDSFGGTAETQVKEAIRVAKDTLHDEEPA